MKPFFLIFHTGKHKNRHMDVVESVLGGLKVLRGQTGICWWSKCIWSLLNARGSWALSQCFVPMILQKPGLCKTQAHSVAREQMRKGVCVLTDHQRKPGAARKGVSIVFANEHSHLKDTCLNHHCLLQKNEIACRTLSFRSEKVIALTLVRLTLQETGQVLSLEAILCPYTAPFI